MPAYAVTIFTGAFLLFSVQPLIGRFILPWFGGAPGVWATCLLFFQTVLLAGYAYAHLSARRLRWRAQAVVHLVLVALALALLPITPRPNWQPSGQGQPMRDILALLCATVGVPFFILSATGPLLQHWFCGAHPGRSPYRLYALSNLGSLLALLSYPFLIEPNFTRQAQARLWSAGLLIYGLSSVICAIRVWRLASASPDCGSVTAAPEATASATSSANAMSDPLTALNGRIFTGAFWLALPACASALLLATTNKLCQDVAVVPFLWIGPLALYLLSFIICFDRPGWYRRPLFALLLSAALGAICWALFKGASWPLWKQLVVYGGGLFICCMVCHGELYRLRPEPGRLTSFYLLIAAGGALGSALVAIVAPLVFTNFFELHCALFGCALLLILIFLAQGTGLLPGPARALPPLARYPFFTVLAIALAALITALWTHARSSRKDAVYESRNFFGVLRIKEYQRQDSNEHYRLLQHGRITHGLQFCAPERRFWPTSYYGEDSGVGLALRALPAAPRHLGLVGLGTGTLASYARPGDKVRVYELNPAVHALATTWFSYLRQCQGEVRVVLGDARLSMEAEPPQQFDLLALDAFSSDAIPVHLLTREAFTLYGRHVKSDGIIAVHISNHFLDLEPVVMNLARACNYQAALVDYEEADASWWLYSSSWILLTHDPKILETPAIAAAAAVPKTNLFNAPLWTDDFASLFRILK